jgi:hypothetical protein
MESESSASTKEQLAETVVLSEEGMVCDRNSERVGGIQEIMKKYHSLNTKDCIVLN